MRRLIVLVCLAVGVAACGSSGDAPAPTGAADGVRVDLDKSDPERLLAFYLGSYLGAEGGDPFADGLVGRQGSGFVLDTARLARRHPGASSALAAAAADGLVDWDEFAAFVQATYYEARALPPTVEALRAVHPFADDTSWFQVRVDGVMSPYERRLYVPVAALRSALAGYDERGGRLLYPVGTAIVGEHWHGEAREEVTVMIKRGDGFWDYAAYGADGRLVGQTDAEPKPLQVPTQCVGCHFGSRLFEPEKSFPARAAAGPNGPRAVHVPDAWRDADLTRLLDEHRRRSDTVLGLYNTLFLARLRAERAAGQLPASDARLLDDVEARLDRAD